MAVRAFALLVCALGCVVTAQAPPVTLTGFAQLPASTFAEGPPSGAWLPGQKGKPRYNLQPVQGVSSLWPVAYDDDAEWWALSDNGFGAKVNSSDYLLRIYRMKVQWSSGAEPGAVAAESFIQLSDPARHLPFAIVREAAGDAFLTGADLDPESLVRMPDGTFWIGDEFGPFLLHFAPNGILIEPPVEFPKLRSPDHPHLAGADAGEMSAATARRSRGFEGLARSGNFLYAALEGGGANEPDFTHIYEFDWTKRVFTESRWRYRFEQRDNALSELVGLRHLTDDCRVRFLAIERDGGQGETAKFKRVYEILLSGRTLTVMPDGRQLGAFALKRQIVDLLAIDNPRRIAGFDQIFTFPFITTEAVWATTRDELVIANDNNFPSTGGRPGVIWDETEFIRLKLPQRLCTQLFR